MSTIMYAQPARDRIGSALAAAAVSAALGWALFVGLAGAPLRERVADGVALFRIDPPAPPPVKVVPKHITTSRPSGRAAPPNIRSQATQVAAPRPIVIVPLPPPPIPVALKPFAGNQSTQGAADRAGPGTGAGGIGDGLGSGGEGDGDGSGGGDTPPRQIGGSLQGARLPPELEENGFQGTVEVDYVVEPNGRATDCRIRRSSGNRAIDIATCVQIERAFRFRPSRDGRGRAVPSVVVSRYDWDVERD